MSSESISENYIDLLLEKEENEYKQFFRYKLKTYGVKSPNELDKETRKKFFKDIEYSWKDKPNQKK